MRIQATLLRLHSDNRSTILLDMRFRVAAAHSHRGAPASMQAKLSCPRSAPDTGGSGTGAIEYELRWHDKSATHVPETIWFSNVPIQLADLEGQPSDGSGITYLRSVYRQLHHIHIYRDRDKFTIRLPLSWHHLMIR